MTSNRPGSLLWLRPALLALSAGLVVAGCSEQSLQSGLDISPPIVAITKTQGDNTTAGTHVAGMMSYLAADGIKKYLANPGPLA